MTRILDIGPQLVTTRRAQGVSQRELGERVGVRQQQIARWEASAYRTADLARVDAVAEALGIDAASMPLPLAAEAPVMYGAPTIAPPVAGVSPVRDLGEVAARIRAHGDELRDRFHIDRIGVFGSFAHGEQTPHSDVDVLVEFTTRPTGFDYFAPPIFLEELLGRNVDVVEERLLHERLRPRIMKDVVYVWEA